MPLVRFRYSLGRVRGAAYATGGYDIALEFRQADGTFQQRAVHHAVKIPASKEFRLVLSVAQMADSHLRLKITRHGYPESACYSSQFRLALRPTDKSVDLGTHRFLDNTWRVAGEIVVEPGAGLDPSRLQIRLEIRSGQTYEEPAILGADQSGKFGFQGSRMFLDPAKNFEVLIRLYDEVGVEVGRYYREGVAEKRIDARIRAGLPFLAVWSAFRATHPQLVERLERFDYHPKNAHRGSDTWIAFRRWDKKHAYQVAEGVVVRAKPGPPGDPDWVWDIRLDPFYDSDDGFRLPNEKNRIKHQGLHVEACSSLSRDSLPQDGLIANHKTVPAGTRVWMLGTYVFDDAWDFGSPDHEHFELHPLYVMESCLGGWYHFAVFESIALAPEAAKDNAAPPRDAWPWTSVQPASYESAYLRLNPHRCLQELALSYTLIYDRFRREKDDEGLVRFFADVSLRYDLYGVDSGLPGMPARRDYMAWARERIAEERAAPIREAIVNRLWALFRFLHGRPSYALDPVQGPVPQSFLRCVSAVENVLAAQATNGQVGVLNPRISLNRATARRVLVLRRETAQLYADLLTAVTDPTSRARLFAGAIERYRNWAVTTSRATERLSRAELIQFAKDHEDKRLLTELRARVNRFWEVLTPYMNK